jgi:hypothetical protein
MIAAEPLRARVECYHDLISLAIDLVGKRDVLRRIVTTLT